jgi:GNAT superfamily N-acetyltransferase
VNVRPWCESDIPAVLPLMRDLAVFEEYLDSFKVDEHVLLEQGFRLEPPNFYCLVAELEAQVVGVLVYYFLPYTAAAKPALFIKELIVAEHARGHGAGTALMRRAALEAQNKGCASMTWTVANWNEAGKRFYESLGASGDPVWVQYGISGDSLDRLAGQV